MLRGFGAKELHVAFRSCLATPPSAVASACAQRSCFVALQPPMAPVGLERATRTHAPVRSAIALHPNQTGRPVACYSADSNGSNGTGPLACFSSASPRQLQSGTAWRSAQACWHGASAWYSNA